MVEYLDHMYTWSNTSGMYIYKHILLQKILDDHAII